MYVIFVNYSFKYAYDYTSLYRKNIHMYKEKVDGRAGGGEFGYNFNWRNWKARILGGNLNRPRLFSTRPDGPIDRIKKNTHTK